MGKYKKPLGIKNNDEKLAKLFFFAVVGIAIIIIVVGSLV